MEFSGLSYSQISEISNTLHSKAGSMTSVLNNVSSQLKKVGDEGTWSGTAASAAFEEFQALMSKFHEFYEAVDACSTYLNRVVENYRAVDSAVTGNRNN